MDTIHVLAADSSLGISWGIGILEKEGLPDTPVVFESIDRETARYREAKRGEAFVDLSGPAFECDPDGQEKEWLYSDKVQQDDIADWPGADAPTAALADEVDMRATAHEILVSNGLVGINVDFWPLSKIKEILRDPTGEVEKISAEYPEAVLPEFVR